jgi:hypothetical protein
MKSQDDNRECDGNCGNRDSFTGSVLFSSIRELGGMLIGVGKIGVDQWMGLF